MITIVSSTYLIILCDYAFALKGVLNNDNNNNNNNNNDNNNNDNNNNDNNNNDNNIHADRSTFNFAHRVKVLRSSLSTKFKQSFELSL